MSYFNQKGFTQIFTLLFLLGGIAIGIYLVLEGPKIFESKAATPKSQYQIGYIGCSNTMQAVEGYHKVTGNKKRFWEPYQTGGMSIEKWANPDHPIWGEFDKQVNVYGQPRAVWVQLCENEERPVTYEHVKAMMANLKNHAPNSAYFISPLNSYDPKNLCSILGPDGIDDLIAFAKQAVEEGLGRPGPRLGPLTVSNTLEDRCHPSIRGRVDPLGKQLVDFFDNL